MRHNKLGQLTLFTAALGLAAAPAFAEQNEPAETQSEAGLEQVELAEQPAADIDQAEQAESDLDQAATDSEQAEMTEQADASEASDAADSDAAEDELATESSEQQTESQSFVIRGTDPAITIIAELADAFAQESGEIVAVEGAGSSQGPAATLSDGVTMTFTSQPLTDEQASEGLSQFPFGSDGIAVITHPGATTGNLTTDELREIFNGQATSWGDGSPITAFAEQASFGAGGTFQAQVLQDESFAETITRADPTTVMQRVAEEQGAIGFVSASSLTNTQGEFDIVTVDSVPLAVETVANETYPLRRTFTLVTQGQPTGTANDFVQFAQGKQGQALIADAGFVPGATGEQVQTASVETDQPAE